MNTVNLVVEDSGASRPIWSGLLALPGVGAFIRVDGVLYEVVSHRYELSAGVVWQSPIEVTVRPSVQ
jgi:hypothetical protein